MDPALWPKLREDRTVSLVCRRIERRGRHAQHHLLWIAAEHGDALLHPAERFSLYHRLRVSVAIYRCEAPLRTVVEAEVCDTGFLDLLPAQEPEHCAVAVEEQRSDV